MEFSSDWIRKTYSLRLLSHKYIQDCFLYLKNLFFSDCKIGCPICCCCCLPKLPPKRVGIMSTPIRQPPPVPARTLSMIEKKKSVDLVPGVPVSVPLSRSPRLLRKMTSTAGGKFSETVDEDASCTTVAIGKDTYTIGESKLKPKPKSSLKS